MKDKSFIRFACVGAFNTLMGVSLFPVLYWLTGKWININVILALSYILCACTAFTLHKHFSFGSKAKSGAEGMRYIFVNAATWAINAILLNLALHYTSVTPVKLQLTIAVLLQIGNYVTFKHFVFAQKKERAYER